MEYGLIGLLIFALSMVFLNFQLWRLTKAEADRISAVDSKRDAEFASLQQDVSASTGRSKTAQSTADAVKAEYYTQLLSKIDAVEVQCAGFARQAEEMARKIASIGGRLSSFARHNKPATADDENGGNPPMPPDDQVHQVAPVNGTADVQQTSFGRVVKRR